jgi:outer membrane protein OmpA-like peptidoglycan-associated protein
LVPSFPPVEKVLNTRYTALLADRMTTEPQAPADVPVYKAKMEHVVSSRDWAINFDTGKATFTGNSIAQLNEMRDGALIADELLIKIQGHTDDTGSADLNRRLSQDRAEAVKRWLMAQGFPEERFVEVKGYGPDVPVADNSTAEGRAQNRRVVVILGS